MKFLFTYSVTWEIMGCTLFAIQKQQFYCFLCLYNFEEIKMYNPTFLVKEWLLCFKQLITKLSFLLFMNVYIEFSGFTVVGFLGVIGSYCPKFCWLCFYSDKQRKAILQFTNSKRLQMPVQITIASKTLNRKGRIKILGNKKLNHFYLQTKLYTMHLKKNFNGKRFNTHKRTPGTNNSRPENQKRGKPKVLQQNNGN